MAEAQTATTKPDSTKMTKTFSPINQKTGELDIKKLIIYAVLLVLGGGTGGGMFIGSLKPDIDKYHDEAMSVMREHLSETRKTNASLKIFEERLQHHQCESEKAETRVMRKLDEIHRDVKK